MTVLHRLAQLGSRSIISCRFTFLGLALALFFVGDAISSLAFRPIVLLSFLFAITVGLTLVVALFVLSVVKEGVKGPIVSTLVLFWFFFYSTLQTSLGKFWPPLLHHRYALPLTIAIDAVLVGYVVWTKRKLTLVHEYSQIVGLALSVYSVVWWITLVNNPTEMNADYASHSRTASASETEFSTPISDLPDIYYIILDAYANTNSLSHFWSFRNEQFQNALRARGFRIVDSAKSPFTRTAPCLASYLDMRIFDGREPARDVIANASALKVLERWGYNVVNLSLFDLPRSRRYYDYPEFQDGSLSDAWLVIRRISVFWIILGLSDADMMSTNSAVRDSLILVTRQSKHSPKFIYAHFMLPHPPYTIDSTGAHIRSGTFGDQYDKNAYLSQLKGTNRFILPMIDTILEHSGRNTIIILQGDHGSRIVDKGRNQTESHSPFDAIRIPQMPDSLFSDSLSPIETFRVVLWSLSVH